MYGDMHLKIRKIISEMIIMVLVVTSLNYVPVKADDYDYFVGFVSNLEYSNIMTNNGDGTYSYDCGYVDEGDTEFGIYYSLNWNDVASGWGIYVVYSSGYGRIVYNPGNDTVDYLVYSDSEYTELIENTSEKPDYYCGTPGRLQHMEKVEEGKYEYECGYVGLNSDWGYGIYGNSGKWSDVVLEWRDVKFQDGGYAKVYYDSVANSSNVKLYMDESYTVLISDLKLRYISINDEYLELCRDDNSQYSYECGYYEKGIINFGILDYDKTVIVENKDYNLEIGGYIKVYFDDNNNNVRVVEYYDDEYSMVSELYYIVGSDYYDYYDKGIFSNCWGHDESEWNVEFQTFDGEPEYLDRVGRINLGNYLIYYSANKAEIGKRYKFSILNGKAGYYTLEDYSFVAISDGYVCIKYYYGTNKCKISYFDCKKIPDIGLLNIELSENEYAYDGEEKKPEVTIEGLTEGEDYTVRYDDDTVNAGKKKVYIKGLDNYAGEEDSETEKEYEIKSKDIEQCNAELYVSQYTYKHGVENHPIPTVMDGDVLLEQGVDYEVEYPEDSSNVGKKEIKISGIGNYSGCITKEFEIKSCDIENYKFELSKEQYVYGGSENKPVVSVIDEETNYELVEYIDFVVEYESNIDVGKAKAIVKGKDNYSGEVELEFEIVEKDISECDIEVNPEKAIYTGDEIYPVVAVKHDDNTLELLKDYEIEYSEDSTNVGEKEIVITGIGNYKGTIKKSYSIDPMSITGMTLTLSENEYIYSGLENNPTVTVEYEKDGNQIQLGENDYVVTISNNVNAGEAKVIVTGKGNYSGEVELKFNIIEKDISECDITIDPTKAIYTGDEIYPVVVVKHDDNILELLKDYEIEYSEDSTNAGEKEIVITGIGNYKGTIKKSYSIDPMSITGMTLTISENEYTYSGIENKPIVTVEYEKDGNQILLGENDYVVEISNNVNAGEAKVIVTGKGNYSGEIEATFIINKKSIDLFNMTVTEKEKEYDGRAFTPNVLVKDGENVLKKDIDYQVVYQDDVTSVGEKVIKIIGIGNYTGEGAVSYKIIEPKKDEKEADSKESEDNKNNKDNNDKKDIPKTGEIIKDKSFSYKVVKSGSKDGIGEIIITKANSKKIKKLKIKDYVVIDGVKYKIVGIGKKAFAKRNKLKNVVIGRNVNSIGVYAFYNCKNLKKVSIKSQLTIKIGKKAFYRKKGKKLIIKVPAKLRKKYKKTMKKARTNIYLVK